MLRIQTVLRIVQQGGFMNEPVALGAFIIEVGEIQVKGDVRMGGARLQQLTQRSLQIIFFRSQRKNSTWCTG